MVFLGNLSVCFFKSCVVSVLADAQHLILDKVNMDDMTDAQIAEIKAAKEKLMGSAQKVKPAGHPCILCSS